MEEELLVSSGLVSLRKLLIERYVSCAREDVSSLN